VRSRYSVAAQEKVEALCCPVDYNQEFLKVIPAEVLERDYGCGDPSKQVRRGETVLDLGCGGGKICFIASQVVGPEGRVIGVDMNDEMLGLARRHQRAVGEAIGWHNVEFRKGRIQDLALDLERLDAELRARPIAGAEAWLAAEALADELRARHPLVATESVDVVVSNCVLNLVESGAKGRLFGEIFRVLRTSGRAVISDIVSDREVPTSLRQDGELWSGCIAGALTEAEFLSGFTDAGFASARVLKRDAAPWRTVDGIEFRSLTLEAGKENAASTAPCCEPGKCC
jgi:SAM-dependent methyltransferase